MGAYYAHRCIGFESYRTLSTCPNKTDKIFELRYEKKADYAYVPLEFLLKISPNEDCLQ